MFMTLPDDSEIQCITCIKLREMQWKENKNPASSWWFRLYECTD